MKQGTFTFFRNTMNQLAEAIENIPDNVLVHVIRHANDYTWNFLALKIILTRLNLKIKMTTDGASAISECCSELRNLLTKSMNIPNSQTDIHQILSIIEQPSIHLSS